MLGPTLDVPDALLPELRLERRLPAPRGVLPALIGEDLLGRPVRGHGARKRLQHELALLVMRQREAHDEARVIVQERCQVHALVPSQKEREDVRLPKLPGLGALEAPLGRLARRRRRRAVLEEPSLVQNAPHLRFADAERRKACKHVADPARAVVGMLRANRHHRVALDLRRRRRAAGRQHRWPRHEGVDTAVLVQLDPVLDALWPRSKDAGGLRQADPVLDHLLDDPKAKCQRVRPTCAAHRGVALACRTKRWRVLAPSRAASSLVTHLRLSLPACPSAGNGGTVLGE